MSISFLYITKTFQTSAPDIYGIYFHLAITVSADVQATNGARPSAETVMATKWDKISSDILAIEYIWMILYF